MDRLLIIHHILRSRLLLRLRRSLLSCWWRKCVLRYAKWRYCDLLAVNATTFALSSLKPLRSVAPM